MLRKKAIDEWALDYWLLQKYSNIVFRIYYRKIEVINKENIPEGFPLIFAPNHQNALMDAMLLVNSFSYQCVFLARADIFKGKRLIRFLTYLNIMPVYRMRDGIENVKKNDEVFERTTRVLHNHYSPLVLFAEGNHGDRRRLRPLVKGLFRIALQAQEKFRNEKAVKIIPIGIDYGHYQNFRTTLFMNIGKPIEVADFYSLCNENPAAAINQLKDTFAAELKKLMIDIQTEEYYELYMNLRDIYNEDTRFLLGLNEDHSLHARFKADKAMIHALDKELEASPETIKQLNEQVIEYTHKLKQLDIRDWVLRKEFSTGRLVFSTLKHMVLLPIFLFGFIHNILPYKFTESKVTNVKDPQFHSSFKYVIGMILFPVWYLVLTGIMAFLSLPIWLIFLYISLLLPTGIAAFDYYISLKKLFANYRFKIKKKQAPILELIRERNNIIKKMHDIIKKQGQHHENIL